MKWKLEPTVAHEGNTAGITNLKSMGKPHIGSSIARKNQEDYKTIKMK